jgi:hypothetical protein
MKRPYGVQQETIQYADRTCSQFQWLNPGQPITLNSLDVLQFPYYFAKSGARFAINYVKHKLGNYCFYNKRLL